MKTRIAWTLFAATFAALLWFGCDDEGNYPIHPPRPYEESVQIVTGTTNDTLWFVSGDSASTTVTVIVTDSYGRAVAGIKVDLSLANASLGVIEFVDESLRDTTNAQGRVNAVYRSFGQEGDQIITATVAGRTANRVLVIRQLHRPIATVTFDTDCDSIIADPFGPDSCEICFAVRDAQGLPIANIAPNVFATGGRLILFPVTDSTGRSCGMWHFRDGSFGEYCFYIANDSICFHLPGYVDPFLINVNADPTHLVACPADTVQTLVTVDVQDGLGNRVRNDTVRVSTTGGTIPQTVLVDSNGYCQFPWTFHNEFGPFQLVASYERWGIRDTLTVEIDTCQSVSFPRMEFPH